MIDLCISSPLIGPFVERNGLAGQTDNGAHLGASIAWSSSRGAVSLNLIKSDRSTYWTEYLAFEGLPNVEFELVFDALFEVSPRLFDFLDELTPFIHPTEHSPLDVNAFNWLTPELARLGFALGHGRAHPNGVTAPIVWVFRKAIKARPLGSPFVGVNYLEWQDGRISLRQPSWVNCSGFASSTLRRFLFNYVAESGSPIVSAEGEARLCSLFERKAEVRAKRSLELAREQSSKSSAIPSQIRALLKENKPIPSELISQAHSLTDNVFLSIVRSAIHLRRQNAFSDLISERELKPSSLRRLLDRCVDDGLSESIELLFKRGNLSEGQSWHYLPQLLRRAVASGNLQTIRTIVSALPKMNLSILEAGISEAVERALPEIVEYLCNSPETKHFSDEAMLRAFSFDVVSQRWDSAMRWLDMGLKPLHVNCATPSRLGDLVNPGTLPLLKRIFETEKASEANLNSILEGCVRLGPEADYVLEVSRSENGHSGRMSKFLKDCVTSFMIWGHSGYIDAVLLAIREGGSLRDSMQELLERNFLRGHDWQIRQDRLITLVGELQRAGYPSEAALAAQVKRSPSP